MLGIAIDAPLQGRTWIRTLLLSLLVGGAVVAQTEDDDLWAEDVRAAQAALARGDLRRSAQIYDDVLLDFEEAGPGDERPSDEAILACRLGLGAIDVRKGRYDRFLDGFAELDESARGDHRLRALYATALERRGRDLEAESVWRGLIEQRPEDLMLRVRLAELMQDHARVDDAERLFDEVKNATLGSDPSAESLMAKARAYHASGAPSGVQQANVYAQRALRADESYWPAQVLYARIRFEVYGEWANADSAEAEVQEVLEAHGDLEEALLLAFESRRSNLILDPSKTESYLRRVLELNPNSVPGLVERAGLTIDDRRFPDAASILDDALEVDAGSVPALSMRAAVAHLLGESEEEAAFRARADAAQPGTIDPDRVLGQKLAAVYRFADAAVAFQRALDVKADDVESLEGLARSLLYTGRAEEAVALLERAKEIQPGFFDPWRKNFLTLQELIETEYQRIEQDGFVFFVHEDDVGVLQRYLIPYQIEAREALGEKYGFIPQEPVRVEILKTWADFSVRTIGFTGFTALGACFGPMITLVSPADNVLRQNDFMWTATVWHEYAHVLALDLSNQRVPRFFTEGCSVHEEGAKNPAWERGMERDLFDAWANDEIPPVRLMNRLFRGSRLLFGYYLGGQLVDFIEERYGFAKVTEMLRLWGEDKTTSQVFETAFDMSTREFDRKFRAYVEGQIGDLVMRPRWSERRITQARARVAADPGNIEEQLILAQAAVQRGVAVDAAPHLREIVTRDEQNTGALILRGDLARERGRPTEAIDFYRRAFELGADDFDARIDCGRLLLAEENIEGAIEHWEAAKNCWPTCTDQGSSPELLLAQLYRNRDRREDALRELRAFCARSARAYQPRLQLAEFARERGDEREERQLLEECVAIDPFDRVRHERLAELAEAAGELETARLELEVAMAVVPEIDRAYLGASPDQRPSADSPEFRESQARLALRIADLAKRLGDMEGERRALERAVGESPDSDAGRAAAARLR
ncbi:MAG: tetratricopeptide repeat protein [Planctomycetota bacterium]